MCWFKLYAHEVFDKMPQRLLLISYMLFLAILIILLFFLFTFFLNQVSMLWCIIYNQVIYSTSFMDYIVVSMYVLLPFLGTLVRLYFFRVMFGVITPLASKQPISIKRQMTGFRCNSQVMRDCNACPCHITLVYSTLYCVSCPYRYLQ